MGGTVVGLLCTILLVRVTIPRVVTCKHNSLWRWCSLFTGCGRQTRGVTLSTNPSAHQMFIPISKLRRGSFLHESSELFLNQYWKTNWDNWSQRCIYTELDLKEIRKILIPLKATLLVLFVDHFWSQWCFFLKDEVIKKRQTRNAAKQIRRSTHFW